MILRITVDNFCSIAEPTVLNLVANPQLKQLPHHITRLAGIDTLRIAALYGPNGSGKSTLIDALRILQDTVLSGDNFPDYLEVAHRFGKGTEKPVTIGIEFVVQQRIYSYAVQFGFERIEREELHIYPKGQEEPELLFSRDGNHNITFYEGWPDQITDSVSSLLHRLLSGTRSAMIGLIIVQHPRSAEFNQVYDWFSKYLLVMAPREFPRGLAHRLDDDPELLKFARDLIKSYHVGIHDIVVEKLGLEEYFGKDDQEQIDYLRAAFKNKTKDQQITKYLGENEEISVVWGEQDPVVKRIQIIQISGTETKRFRLSEVSDGTSRLLELIPAFYRIVHERHTVVIDELERSIHPAMIRALVAKFSADERAKGQLIFTTHEDILLDQAILRRDGTYFIEKSEWRGSSIHSLNKFKPHHTKNIRRGYLEGRYGGVPYVTDLTTINWGSYDT